jgi:hypothetical protein
LEDSKEEYGGVVMEFREKISVMKDLVLDEACRAFKLHTGFYVDSLNWFRREDEIAERITDHMSQIEQDEKDLIRKAKAIEIPSKIDKKFAIKFCKELETQVYETILDSYVEMREGTLPEEEYEMEEFIERLWFRDQLLLKFEITEDQYILATEKMELIEDEDYKAMMNVFTEKLAEHMEEVTGCADCKQKEAVEKKDRDLLADCKNGPTESAPAEVVPTESSDSKPSVLQSISTDANTQKNQPTVDLKEKKSELIVESSKPETKKESKKESKKDSSSPMKKKLVIEDKENPVMDMPF